MYVIKLLYDKREGLQHIMSSELATYLGQRDIASISHFAQKLLVGTEEVVIYAH